MGYSRKVKRDRADRVLLAMKDIKGLSEVHKAVADEMTRALQEQGKKMRDAIAKQTLADVASYAASQETNKQTDLYHDRATRAILFLEGTLGKKRHLVKMLRKYYRRINRPGRRGMKYNTKRRKTARDSASGGQ